jgi:hypothetical protein
MEILIRKIGEHILSNKSKETISFTITLLCLFLFLYTGYSKIMEHARFMKGLSRVELIGSYALYISWIVPLTEILVAILMIIPKTQKVGLYAFLGLMILFTIYIISVLIWEVKLPCHCGGVIETLSWGQHVWFNLVFIGLACYALWLRSEN